jgi:hypothetical protein
MSAPVTQVRPIRPDRSGYRHASLSIGLLVLAALGYLGALEISARVLYPAHSALAARIRSDWRAALRSGVSPSHDRRSFLVVGNSLLQAGIDRKQLSALQQDSALNVAILPIESTDYLDWYFGVQRLFAEGSKPEFVVLCLAPVQLISDSTNGVAFARTLMRPVDILRVKRAAGLDWTTTSTYLMASASAWIGDSTEIRNWIRSETVPGMAGLAPYFWQRAPANPRADVMEETVGLRLEQLSAVCAAHACKGVLVIPPLLRDRGDGSLAAIARAGRAAGVPVLMPVAPGELAQSYFKDGFHLNQRGAEIFTPRLLEALREIPDNGLAGVEAMPSLRCSRSNPAVQC